ncbi:MAG: hypothetical protein ABR517_06260 [Thermoanaerobaculia bacterium]
MSRHGVHVIRDDDRWWVLREGEDGVPPPAYRRLREALRLGKAIARLSQTELTVYDEQGRVRHWSDYREA